MKVGERLISLHYHGDIAKKLLTLHVDSFSGSEDESLLESKTDGQPANNAKKVK